MAVNLFSRIKNLMARGIVTLLESGGYQVTLLNGEVRSNLEHLQEFGLASVQPTGVKGNGICCFYGGNRSNGSLLVMEFPDIKPTLSAGESAVYNAHNALITLTDAGLIKEYGTGIELNGVTNEGIIKINELTTAINALVTAYNSHQHGYIAGGQGFSTTDVTLVQQVPLVKTDYENDKVVH